MPVITTVKDLEGAYTALFHQQPTLLPKGVSPVVRIIGKSGRKIRCDSRADVVGEDARIEITFEPSTIDPQQHLTQQVFHALYKLEESEVQEYTVLTWFLKKHLPAMGFSQSPDQLREALSYLINEGFVNKEFIPNPKNNNIPVAIISINRKKLAQTKGKGMMPKAFF